MFVLILTRGQFLALIAALILIVSYIIFKKKSFVNQFYFLAILIVIPILTSFTERVYNKIVFGHFENNAMNYVHFIASPFYIANESDINLFTKLKLTGTPSATLTSNHTNGGVLVTGVTSGATGIVFADGTANEFVNLQNILDQVIVFFILTYKPDSVPPRPPKLN